MPVYTQKITWHDDFGAETSITCSGDNRLEVISHAWSMAKSNGWARPRWYEFWRWRDQTYDWIRDEIEIPS